MSTHIQHTYQVDTCPPGRHCPARPLHWLPGRPTGMSFPGWSAPLPSMPTLTTTSAPRPQNSALNICWSMASLKRWLLGTGMCWRTSSALNSCRRKIPRQTSHDCLAGQRRQNKACLIFCQYCFKKSTTSNSVCPAAKTGEKRDKTLLKKCHGRIRPPKAPWALAKRRVPPMHTTPD